MEQGIYEASHFISSGEWVTFEMLTSRAGRYQLDLWLSAQFRHYLHTLHAPVVFERKLFPLEEYYIERGPLSHTISKIYTLLAAPSDDFQLPFFQKWEVWI